MTRFNVRTVIFRRVIFGIFGGDGGSSVGSAWGCRYAVVDNGRCERVERHSVDPGPMSRTTADDSLTGERPDRHEVVLAAGGDVPPVRRPRDATQTTEVALHRSNQLHLVVVEHAKLSVGTNNGQVMRARRKGERVDGSRTVDEPPVEWIASAFGATGVNGIADALLEHLVARRRGTARQSFVVDVQLSAGVSGEKMIRRPRNPLDEGDFRVVDEPLCARETKD